MAVVRVTTLSHDEQVALALRRIGRFRSVLEKYGDQLNEAGLQFLRDSIFSAYLDCRALGIDYDFGEVKAGEQRDPNGEPALRAA